MSIRKEVVMYAGFKIEKPTYEQFKKYSESNDEFKNSGWESRSDMTGLFLLVGRQLGVVKLDGDKNYYVDNTHVIKVSNELTWSLEYLLGEYILNN